MTSTIYSADSKIVIQQLSFCPTHPLQNWSCLPAVPLYWWYGYNHSCFRGGRHRSPPRNLYKQLPLHPQCSMDAIWTILAFFFTQNAVQGSGRSTGSAFTFTKESPMDPRGKQVRTYLTDQILCDKRKWEGMWLYRTGGFQPFQRTSKFYSQLHPKMEFLQGNNIPVGLGRLWLLVEPISGLAEAMEASPLWLKQGVGGVSLD